MSKIYKMVALVPMRHDSERVVGKNYRKCVKKPLFHYIIKTLLSSRCIEKVVIDTDSQTIKDGINRDFPEVMIMDRQPELRAGEISMNKIILHDISVIPAENYLQTHCTNPLLSLETINMAIEKYYDIKDNHDSLFSVTRQNKRYWDGSAEPVNHDPGNLLRTQDLKPLYEENSCLYIFSKKSMMENNNRIGSRPYMFEMREIESWDIDNEDDFQMAELLINKYYKE